MKLDQFSLIQSKITVTDLTDFLSIISSFQKNKQ